MLAIRLPEDIEARLDKLAKRTGRTKTYYARQAILEHLADLEDVYLAEKRLEELRTGRKRSIPIYPPHETSWLGRLSFRRRQLANSIDSTRNMLAAS